MLVLMDITAGCDHAQGKDDWRRMIVGCRVPFEHQIHLWRLSKDGVRQPGLLRSDNLLATPVLKDDSGEFMLVLDANLPISLPRDGLQELEPNYQGRIREALLQDRAQRIAFHSARPGHVALG